MERTGWKDGGGDDNVIVMTTPQQACPPPLLRTTMAKTSRRASSRAFLSSSEKARYSSIPSSSACFRTLSGFRPASTGVIPRDTASGAVNNPVNPYDP